MNDYWSPLFQWGFSFRRSKHLVPILSNNLIVLGNDAVVGNNPQRRLLSEVPETTLISRKQNSKSNQTEPNSPSSQHFQQNSSLSLPSLSDIDLNTKLEFSQTIEKKEQLLSSSSSSCSLNESQNILLRISSSNNFSSEDLIELEDEEIINLIEEGKLSAYSIDSKLGISRAVRIRRKILKNSLGNELNLDSLVLPEIYTKTKVGLCENLIGCISIPVGIAGPLIINNKSYYIPMATTEGCLVASTHRGCKAISSSGGASVVIVRKGMSRGPVIRFPNIIKAFEFKEFMETEEAFELVSKAFNNESRFARLKSIKITLAGRNIYMRFVSSSGDAMGMNMLSKGTEASLRVLCDYFPELEVISLSGNYCTDKKPSSINWIEGRGHSMVCEAVIKKDIVEKVLKTTVDAMIELNISKNLVGSAMAGSIGGYNAHASNIVTAIFIATGQDAAQNVESSNCITLMEKTLEGDLLASVTMPSIEVGTIGGGTNLPGASACLEILGINRSNTSSVGENSDILATVICAGVLAGELSLMAALRSGDLVKSHMKYNR